MYNVIKSKKFSPPVLDPLIKSGGFTCMMMDLQDSAASLTLNNPSAYENKP